MAKRPSLRNNLDAGKAAAAVDAIAGKTAKVQKAKASPKSSVIITPDDEPHSTQSYNLPTRQIELLARVAMERAMKARHAGQKGKGRISASAIMRDLIERHIDELQHELDNS